MNKQLEQLCRLLAAARGCRSAPASLVKHASCTRTATSDSPSGRPLMITDGSVYVCPPSTCMRGWSIASKWWQQQGEAESVSLLRCEPLALERGAGAAAACQRHNLLLRQPDRHPSPILRSHSACTHSSMQADASRQVARSLAPCGGSRAGGTCPAASAAASPPQTWCRLRGPPPARPGWSPAPGPRRGPRHCRPGWWRCHCCQPPPRAPPAGPLAAAACAPLSRQRGAGTRRPGCRLRGPLETGPLAGRHQAPLPLVQCACSWPAP